MKLDFHPLKAICQETAQTRIQEAEPERGYSDTSPAENGRQRATRAATGDAAALQQEIRESIRAGADPGPLLLKALDCIGLLTGNRLFSVDAAEDMRLVMPGVVDSDNLPLQWRIEEARERLARLRTLYDTGTLAVAERERVRAAINAHVKALEYMERAMDK